MFIQNTTVNYSLTKASLPPVVRASWDAGGLREEKKGNSEVGHLNIGSGRVVPQDLVRISDAVEDGSINQNPALVKLCGQVINSNGKLHIVGLCSEGGVHSHLNHLFGLLDLAKAQGIKEVCIHAIADGRDTLPTEGFNAIGLIQDYIDRIGIGRIVTISGRYYAMDRDKRWDRIQRAYDVMTQDGEGDGRSAVETVKDSYDRGITDEFIEPVRIAPGAIEAKDGVIFFNFRPDRARQLTQAFVSSNFDGFPKIGRASCRERV